MSGDNSFGKSDKKSSYREKNLGVMTERDLGHYLDLLEVSEEELNKEGSLILDLGSGVEQNLAKEAREKSLKPKIVSIDPRLGLSPDEDINLSSIDKIKRLQARRNPEPLTLAAVSEMLPLKDNSFNHVYAVFSVPYYLDSQKEIEDTLEEILRVLMSGGSARIFPVPADQILIVKNLLDKKDGLVSYQIKNKGIGGDDDDNLLVINKI